MQGSYAIWWFWVSIAQVFVNAVIGVFVLWSGRQKATRASISALHRRIDDQDTRTLERCGQHKELIRALQENSKHALTLVDLGEVYDKVGEVKTSVDRQTGTLAGISRQVDMLVEHHLRGERK